MQTISILRQTWLIVLVVSTVALAQYELQPSLDLAQYLDQHQSGYLEIYYSLPDAAIKYAKQENDATFKSRLVLDIKIYRNQDLWASKLWKIEKEIDDPSAVEPNSQLVDLLRYMLEEPGDYRFVLHTRDLNQGERIDSSVVETSIRPLSTQKLELSDLVFASEIKRADKTADPMFVKSGYAVIPNPRRIYGEGASTVYYYFESYNLSAAISGAKYKTYCAVKDADGNQMADMGANYRTKTLHGNTSVEIGMTNVSQLPTGIYNFVYGIADTGESMLASQSKKFYVYNPAVTPAEFVEVTGTAVFGALAGMLPNELDDEFARMVHISKREERDFYKGLKNPDAKRRFISSIWENNTPKDNIPTYAYREIYLRRAQQAEQQFSNAFRPGWNTDMGRVFIVYGPPNFVDRFENEPSTKPYQTWTYDNLEGRVEFVFADRTGFKNYELMHSTKTGERYNPTWRNQIAMGSNSMSN